MKATSSAFKAHLASADQTTSQCLYVLLKNGEARRFTDHDRDIAISGWASPNTDLNGTYLAAEGFLATAIDTSAGLNVDNVDASGPQVTPAILELELIGGTWDDARFTLFEVNWATISNGPNFLRAGRIGEVTLEDGRFKTEVRGIMQEYTKTLGELTSPGCRNDLGDARCRADLAPFAITGTVTDINLDNMTIYDSGLTEDGPVAASVAITSITNANPGVVTLADASLNLVNGQAITISGVVGMPLLNVVTVALNPSGTTFQLSIDTTDTAVYGTYTSGGTVQAFSGTGGTGAYFDGGKITFTSGAMSGLSMEIKSYVPGQITLGLPTPFAVMAGDTYIAFPGCDKTVTMCRDRYNNIVNFVGEPYLRGIDQLVQVGRHS